MNIVLIRINAGQEGIGIDDLSGVRVIDVPASARLLSTADGWKLEVPGQRPFWLPPDVQVVQPWGGKQPERREGR